MMVKASSSKTSTLCKTVQNTDLAQMYEELDILSKSGLAASRESSCVVIALLLYAGGGFGRETTGN